MDATIIDQLIARNPRAREALKITEQLKQIRFITDTNPQGVALSRSDGSENMVADLRTNSAVPINPNGFIPYNNNAFIVTQTSSSATVNGTALKAAYVLAKALTPNGSALSALNRAAVIVTPGDYDFGEGGELVLDTQFVDIIGWLADRKAQKLISSQNTTGLSKGTIHKQVDDVIVANLTVRVSSSLGIFDNTLAAWWPDAGYSNEQIINCDFDEDATVFNTPHAMRLAIPYAGYYERCRAGAYAWGQGANFSGYALDCICSGEGGFGSNATCSGVLVNCEAQTRYGFGGQGGTFSGKAFNCRVVENAFVATGTFSGTAIGCIATGTVCFGGGGAISATGRIIGCIYRADTFVTPAAGGFIVGSIDATGIVNFPAVGFSNPMTTSGDIIYGGASGVATRRAVGGNNALAYVNAGLPDWFSAGGIGSILYINGSGSLAWLTASSNTGAALQCVGGLPVWVGGTPPASTEDYLAGQVFNPIDRQVFSITTYNG